MWFYFIFYSLTFYLLTLLCNVLFFGQLNKLLVSVYKLFVFGTSTKTQTAVFQLPRGKLTFTDKFEASCDEALS